MRLKKVHFLFCAQSTFWSKSEKVRIFFKKSVRALFVYTTFKKWCGVAARQRAF